MIDRICNSFVTSSDENYSPTQSKMVIWHDINTAEQFKREGVTDEIKIDKI